MDELVSVLSQYPDLAAGFFGPGFIDSRYERGSRDHRYCTAVHLLATRHTGAWLTYFRFRAFNDGPRASGKPSREEFNTLKTWFGPILDEVGIERWPLDPTEEGDDETNDASEVEYPRDNP